MILEIILFVIVISLIIYFRKKNEFSPLNGLKQIPDVKGGFPIFGHIFDMTSNPYEYLTDLRGTHGQIFTIQLGWKKIIVMNNFDYINKCLKEHGNMMTGRWQNIFTKHLALDSGILFTEGEWWAVQRSFTLRVLRDFGFGKKLAETVIQREAEKLIKIIQSSDGKDINTSDLVSVSTVNIISDFIMGKEYEETDQTILSIIQTIKTLGQAADINSLLMNLFPIFDWYPKLSLFLVKMFHPLNIIQIVDSTTDYISSIIDEHRQRFNPENECHDLIDAFLLEQNKSKNSKETSPSFTNWQLVRLISELFLAGYETTSTTLSWSLLLLAKFPEIQKKAHDEIVHIIGVDRLPTMADKKSLNYCQAVIDEIYRFSTVLPLSIAHRALENTSVNGYFIPKNAVIFPNLYGCHRDPLVWEKPYDFYPNHFLDDSGKFQPKPELITFGVGKRQCLGEGLAKMEEFIFLICFLQKFEISLGENYINIDTKEILNGSKGTFRGTLDHKLNFKRIINLE